MKETRFFYVPDAAVLTELPSGEATHALKVLRLTEDDEIMLMDGRGCFYKAVVTMATNHHCVYTITEQLPQPRPWQGHIHLAIAPTKMNERMEWMAEKAVEVGLDISAMKQSRKAYLPKVNDLTSFSDFINAQQSGHRYIAHCYEEIPRVNLFDDLCRLDAEEDTLVLIGPEGDFSIGEVQQAVNAGFISVNLGDSRLRTETAGLSAVMMMQLSKQIIL